MACEGRGPKVIWELSVNMKWSITLLITFVMLLGIVAQAAADSGYKMEAAAGKKPNRSTESFLPQFSLSKAAEYLDAGSRAHEMSCVSCHGTFAYLAACPATAGAVAKNREARQFLEEIAGKWATVKMNPKTPSLRASQIVMAAAVLAQDDAITTGKLHPLTLKLFDWVWDLQQEDGGWNWAKKNQAPSEIDDHFGVTMAAIGVGVAPDHYAETPQARKGLEGIRRYLREHPPATMHQRCMLLLAAASISGLINNEEAQRTVADLFALQRPDGGWAMPGLGNWQRVDDVPLDPNTSDGYGTGFALYVLRNGGKISADDPRLQKGVLWLKSHQRISGCWFTRSPHKNNELCSYVGSAYAILGLDACGAIRPK